ncbi:hypothetical protein C8J57DRAFT_1573390 [Mycena rebaudengoi]|nr:hypothetical protein C8J57DRAFT_1573390 [Mycena rebaudengoi]
MEPAVHGEDPPINVLHRCAHCHSRMGKLRVHEGTNKPRCRGRVIQVCVSCFKSHYHTEAYIYSDAEHLLVRFNARQLGHPIPPESANAPLRFQPTLEQELPSGPVQCGAVGCTTKSGDRRQAARKCIETLCKNCCVQAGADAAEQQMYRDSCKVHQVPSVAGRRVADARAPAPQPAAPTQPAQPVQPPAPNLPPPHGQAGRGHRIPVAHAGGPVARPRQLAQPMALPWVNQRQVVLREKGPDPKAERQRLEKLEQQSCDLIVYHTLSSTALLQGLGMTENSWFDVYNYAESSWKTLQATAVFLVDKAHPTIIRIRPSLLAELALNECPGIEDLLTQQPRTVKRKLYDMVSPPKKLARTDVVPDTTQARNVIIIDSPPPSPTFFPSTSGPVVSTSTASASETQQAKSWPGGYYVYEHEVAWIKYKSLKDERGQNKVSIHGAWDQLFPGSKFVHTTVTSWRKFWKNAPQDVKDHCINEGRKQRGSWQYFVDAVRAHKDGRPFDQPVVKNEPSSSTGLQSNPTPPVPPPAAPVIPEMSPNIAVNNPPASELCVFCDTQIIVRPSPKLDQIFVDILPLTQSSPTLQNPNHRTADSRRIYAAYCKQHETDSCLLPVARVAGWPERIDYFGLRERVEKEVLPMLQDLLGEVKEADFFLDAVAGKFKKATGYFGELGYYAIFHAVADKFPAVTIFSDHSPLTWGALIEQVLVPEAIVALILMDLHVDYDTAVEILEASTDFGLHYHSDPHDRQRSHIIHSPPPEYPRLPAEVTQVSSSFPLSSPLGSPAPSPHLAPVNWDIELDFDRDPDPDGHGESAVVAAGCRSTAAGNRWIAAASAATMSHCRSVTLPVATKPLALQQTAADCL